jgi:stringent starvation protein B
MPRVGDPVSVVFLAARIEGVVTKVDVDVEARRVLVATADGQTLAFELSRATGTFLADGQQSGARLLFER